MENSDKIVDESRQLIKNLDLLPHPEGGWYKETYRSKENIPGNALPERFGGARSCSTAIYFLLNQGEISSLHRIKSDELWCFHSGGSLSIHIISLDGIYSEIKLGSDMDSGEFFQALVPAGSWFGAEITGPYVLISAVVSPGFDFNDFELGDRTTLLSLYPEHSNIVKRLTR